MFIIKIKYIVLAYKKIFRNNEVPREYGIVDITAVLISTDNWLRN